MTKHFRAIRRLAYSITFVGAWIAYVGILNQMAG
jgi:hypothetical protein